MRQGEAGRIFAWFGFALGVSALILQASLTIPERMAQGHSLGGAIEFLFSFFTILSNSALVLVHLAVASEARGLAPLRRPVVRTAMAALMLFVTAFFHIVLSPTFSLHGWWSVANIALHYVAPLYYVACWMAFAPHAQARFASTPMIVAWPLAYAIYAVARGAVLAEYPYPVLNATKLGYDRVALNIGGLLVVFVVLCAAVIAVDRWLGQRVPQGEGARQA